MNERLDVNPITGIKNLHINNHMLCLCNSKRRTICLVNHLSCVTFVGAITSKAVGGDSLSKSFVD